MPCDQYALSSSHALWSEELYSDLCTFSTQQYLRLCLYNTMVYFHEAKPCKMYMFTKMELATNFNFMEVLQDYCCLHMLLAPIKEKKVTHQAWIKVFTARDYPNVFPQSILIHALSLH